MRVCFDWTAERNINHDEGEVMGFIGDLVENIIDPGGKAADTALQASQTQAGAQTQALNYLKEREEIPQQFREEALKGLGGIYGLEGGTGSQQDLIDMVIQSPLYKQIMGGLDVGEDAILRNATATGGFRSGNTQYNLADYATRLQNNALLQSYNEQLMVLQGLAGLPSMAPQISNKISEIGQTLGQGQVAAGQAREQSVQDLTNMGLTIAGMFSDRRLKNNIRKIGTVKGHNWYSFEWNSLAEKLGLSGNTYGCMADEVYDKVPEAVSLRNGFLFVNYSILGIIPKGVENA